MSHLRAANIPLGTQTHMRPMRPQRRVRTARVKPIERRGGRLRNRIRRTSIANAPTIQHHVDQRPTPPKTLRQGLHRLTSHTGLAPSHVSSQARSHASSHTHCQRSIARPVQAAVPAPPPLPRCPAHYPWHHPGTIPACAISPLILPRSLHCDPLLFETSPAGAILAGAIPAAALPVDTPPRRILTPGAVFAPPAFCRDRPRTIPANIAPLGQYPPLAPRREPCSHAHSPRPTRPGRRTRSRRKSPRIAALANTSRLARPLVQLPNRRKGTTNPARCTRKNPRPSARRKPHPRRNTPTRRQHPNRTAAPAQHPTLPYPPGDSPQPLRQSATTSLATTSLATTSLATTSLATAGVSAARTTVRRQPATQSASTSPPTSRSASTSNSPHPTKPDATAWSPRCSAKTFNALCSSHIPSSSPSSKWNAL